jgi:hypothetical protein
LPVANRITIPGCGRPSGEVKRRHVADHVCPQQPPLRRRLRSRRLRERDLSTGKKSKPLVRVRRRVSVPLMTFL